MVKDRTILVENITAEQDDFYSDDDLYNITSWGADLSFRELITMYEEDELKKPELQRNYVWDKNEASRFLESLLMGLPVPSIFLAKVGEDKLIIDGYQRIMTVFDYVKKGIFSKDKKVFKLSNSENINEKWRGKAFMELTELEQKKIRSTTIHAIIFEQKHPHNDDTSLYQIFERINTGGRSLMPQEIRNCVYQGLFNSALIEMNNDPNWRKLFGVMETDFRMRDIELILRFLALRSQTIKNSESKQVSLKKFLNIFMGSEESNKSKVVAENCRIFSSTMQYISQHLGQNAFKNISVQGNFIERFHPTIFDSIAIATAYAIGKDPNVKIQTDKHLSLLKDVKFKKYIYERTTNIEHINGRIQLALRYLFGMDYE